MAFLEMKQEEISLAIDYGSKEDTEAVFSYLCKHWNHIFSNPELIVRMTCGSNAMFRKYVKILLGVSEEGKGSLDMPDGMKKLDDSYVDWFLDEQSNSHKIFGIELIFYYIDYFISNSSRIEQLIRFIKLYWEDIVDLLLMQKSSRALSYLLGTEGIGNKKFREAIEKLLGLNEDSAKRTKQEHIEAKDLW